MEISFEALPYLVSDSQRGVLRQWRTAAVRRERELVTQRQARLQGLREYVIKRLEEIEERKHQQTSQSVRPAETDQPSFSRTTTEGRGLEMPSQTARPAETTHPSFSRPTTMGRGLEMGTADPVRSSEIVRRGEDIVDSSVSGGGRSSDLFYQDYQRSGQQSWIGNTDCRSRHLPSEITSVDEVMIHSSPLVASRPSASQLPPEHGTYYTSPRTRLFTPREDAHSLPSPPHPVQKDPYMKLTAVAKGFLTRRLLQSEKVNHYATLIKDASIVLDTMGEPTSQADLDLLERVSTQLQVAKMNLHEIVFDLPVEERMAYIAHSRVLQHERKLRQSEPPQSNTSLRLHRPAPPSTRTASSLTVSNDLPTPAPCPPGTRGGKLSSATMKAIERRQRQKAANTSVLTGSQTTGKAETTNLHSRQERVVKPDRQVTTVTRKRGRGVSSAVKPGSHGLKGRGKENHVSAKKTPRQVASKPGSGAKQTHAK